MARWLRLGAVMFWPGPFSVLGPSCALWDAERHPWPCTHPMPGAPRPQPEQPNTPPTWPVSLAKKSPFVAPLADEMRP